ncbi:hypothetical protein KO02_18610 [Sphingobacterium sp. ML3W]|uniref:RNA polymerase sigma factor n=1 Tax=Sphingobacterium sp. ML3W TaxID=1538644 RepID=UPI0004F719A7|nr:sigma-70 family RNA polymerase sigma factor [Sphingobacterium sp. ML3W]AIM38476.1 hypothetical protein KO02_18610 [Sphingobacterium sp. ML3W]
MEIDALWYIELKNGNENGLNRFMKLYLKPLSFFAYNIVQSKELTEELVVDAFLKVWNYQEKFQSDQHAVRFLYQVTKNACLNAVEKNKHVPPFDYELDNLLIYDDTDIQQQIIYDEFLQQVEKELAKLSEQQRNIFRMSCMQGYSTQEICLLLETTPQVVFNAKSKSIKHLRNVLDKPNNWFGVILFSCYLGN